MEWLNIHSSILDSEEFIGCEPTDRATWLCLMRYCSGQENGGIIVNCKDWSDRRWQQTVRITAVEVERICPLWKWSGSDLIVKFYPVDKELEVKAKRSRISLINAQRDAVFPFPSEGESTGETELPTLEQAIASLLTCAIPNDFAAYVYGDWSSRQGKDASGVACVFLRYAKKRWEREKVDWAAKTHKGNKPPGQILNRYGPHPITKDEAFEKALNAIPDGPRIIHEPGPMPL